MTGSSDLEPIYQTACADIGAGEVERAPLHHNAGIEAPIPSVDGKIADTVAASISLLPPPHQQAVLAIQQRLANFASEFVHALTSEAVRLLEEAAAGRGKFLAADANGSPEPLLPTAQRRAAALDNMVMEDWAGPVAGQTYLEKNLRIPRSTLHMWQRRNEIIALRKGRCKHVFPLAQFVDGRPAPGIRDLLPFFSNPRLAWFWLNSDCPELGGRIPIELLRHERVAEVISVARALASDRYPG